MCRRSAGMTSLIYRTVRRHCSNFCEIERSVVISESNDIYTNLALEDWFYRHGDFRRNKHMLMLWSNNPCVVIGKFQNPWFEANVSELAVALPDGVKLARRNSGGGTVYHDRGNLNLTFFTPREHYKRKDNLEVIARAVLNEYRLKIDITPREDLVMADKKVSGTASKLGRLIAYHHCTLLVNANKAILSRSLRKPNYTIETNATKSVKSQVLNLADIDSSITVENLMTIIGREYLRTVRIYKNSDNESPKPNRPNEEPNEENITKFRVIRPNEDEFPGLTDIRDNLASWDWNFGKCPKFVAMKSCYDPLTSHEPKELLIKLTVEEGVVKNVLVENSSENTTVDLSADFTDRKFGEHIFNEAYECFKDAKRSECIRKTV